MKKWLVFLLLALLALAPCHAEDMEIMDWASPTPAPTSEPTPTPSPAPASYENFQDIEVEGVAWGFGREFYPMSEIMIEAIEASAEIEDVRFSWTDQAEYREIEEDIDATVNQDTDAGRTVYKIYPDCGTYTEELDKTIHFKELDLYLPDIPELEGDQWINFRVGDERVNVNLRLKYLGDYQKDQGWELENWSFTVARVVGPAEGVGAVGLQTGKIRDSWEEILAAIDDGTAKERYAVGAWKELELDGIGTINMQLAGFELDTLSGGAGKAATTWIAKDLLPETRRMNQEYRDGRNGTGAIGGWESCELRAYLQEEVLQAFPAVVRDRVQWVDKEQTSLNMSRTKVGQTTSDNLWIPSLEEVFGEDSLYYELFQNSTARLSKVLSQSSSSSWWWLRSVYNATGFYYVGSNGRGNSFYANYSGGIALGFCL